MSLELPTEEPDPLKGRWCRIWFLHDGQSERLQEKTNTNSTISFIISRVATQAADLFGGKGGLLVLQPCHPPLGYGAERETSAQEKDLGVQETASSKHRLSSSEQTSDSPLLVFWYLENVILKQINT